MRCCRVMSDAIRGRTKCPFRPFSFSLNVPFFSLHAPLPTPGGQSLNKMYRTRKDFKKKLKKYRRRNKRRRRGRSSRRGARSGGVGSARSTRGGRRPGTGPFPPAVDDRDARVSLMCLEIFLFFSLSLSPPRSGTTDVSGMSATSGGESGGASSTPLPSGTSSAVRTATPGMLARRRVAWPWGLGVRKWWFDFTPAITPLCSPVLGSSRRGATPSSSSRSGIGRGRGRGAGASRGASRGAAGAGGRP